MQKERTRNFSPSNGCLPSLLELAQNLLKLFAWDYKSVMPFHSVVAIFRCVAEKFTAKLTSDSYFSSLCLFDCQSKTASQPKRHMIAVGTRKFFGLAVFAWSKSCLYRIFPKMEENAIFFLGPHAGLARKTAEYLHGRYSSIQGGIGALNNPAILPNLVSSHCSPLSQCSITRQILTSSYQACQ